MTDDCESWEAEQARVVSELRQRLVSYEEQLCRIANYLGKDARHAKDGTIAGLVIENVERLTIALRDIMRHQECIGGDLAKIGATWRIAERAVRGE